MEEIVRVRKCDICRGPASLIEVKVQWDGSWFEFDLCEPCGQPVADALVPVLKQLSPLRDTGARQVSFPTPAGYKWMVGYNANRAMSAAHLTTDGRVAQCGFHTNLEMPAPNGHKRCRKCMQLGG